jgi:hypothetical protein
MGIGHHIGCSVGRIFLSLGASEEGIARADETDDVLLVFNLLRLSLLLARKSPIAVDPSASATDDVTDTAKKTPRIKELKR